MVDFCNTRIKARFQTKSVDRDIAGWSIDEFKMNELGRDKEDMQNLLTGNVITAIVGGSETSAATLIVGFYYLCVHPVYAEELYEELMVSENSRDFNLLAKLPRLNGIINESMRLFPAGLTVGWRNTGPQGLWIEDIFVPPNTTTVSPRFTVSRLLCAFD
jgi:cytochrome P450